MSSLNNSDTNNNGAEFKLKNDVQILPKDNSSVQTTKNETPKDIKRNSIVLPNSRIVLTDAYPKHVKSFEEILEDLGNI